MALENNLFSVLTPGSGTSASASTLEVNVIFTTVEETLPALRRAGDLAKDLNASIQLLVPQVVPYPLPLECPPAGKEFTARRFRTMVGRHGVATRVQLILCRDKEIALQDKLQHHSLIVIGGRKHWWKTGEPRLARKLRALGHEVIYQRT